MPTYCIYLFGAPRVERDSQAIVIPRRKSLALLAYLAVTGQPHSREALATMFWPEYDQSQALANLRRDLSALKSTLGGELLRIDRQNIGLNPEADLWLDVAEFQRRVAQAEAHNHQLEKSCTDCLAGLREAEALYLDAFMAGFNLPDSPGYDEWQFFESEGLRQALGEILQILIEEQSGRGAYEPAIEYARRWLALDALHEPAHRQLMRLYALSGQHSAALRQYQECVRLFEEELGLPPEEETRQLYEAIRAKKISPQAEEKPVLYNLPSQATAFIGRERELLDLRQLLTEAPDHRLITLLGPGGIGKTRLALEAASSVAEQFSHGTCFVPLAAIRSPTHIGSLLAESLNLHDLRGDYPRQQVLDYLKGRQVLLVMDNFEHLLDGAHQLDEILQSAPEVKILATSRERLALSSENLYVLAGMAYPEGEEAEQVQEYDAIALLLQCIRRLKPDFEPRERDLRAMIALCQLVAGMPLALVLAAGWVEILGLEEIVAEISGSLDILAQELRDLPERQRSMRAVFDYSWNLLAEGQRQALMKCSVFQGGFTRPAAQAVAGASIRTLLALVNKSWLQRDEVGRYQIHELTRQYIQAKLALDSAAYDRAREEHSAYFAGLLEDLDRKMRTSKQAEAFRTVSSEFENIRAAWHWFIEQKQTETAIRAILPALFRYCEARKRSYELQQLIQEARISIEDRGQNISNQSYACLLTAKASFFRSGFPVRFETFGMVPPAEDLALQQAWSLAARIEDLQEMKFWGVLLVYLYGRIIHLDEGIHLSRQLVDHLRLSEHPSRSDRGTQRDNDLWELAFSLELLLQLLEIRFEPGADAIELEQIALESLEIFKAVGDERECGFILRSFGQLRRLQRNFPEAIKNWQLAQEKLRAVGDWATAADIHWQLGDVYLQMGEFDSAFHHYRAMNQVYEEKGTKRAMAQMLSKESYEALRYSNIDHAWQTRQRSLAYAREVGDVFGEGWSLWELGEIYRVKGDADRARACYQEAKNTLDRFEDPSGSTFYHRGLGDLALTRQDFKEAARQFEESRRYAQTSEHQWAVTYALAGLGRAASGSGDAARAQAYFLEALKEARAMDELGIALVVLAGVAEMYTASGDLERARDLATLVVHHHVSWRETKEIAQLILDRLASLNLANQNNKMDRKVNELDAWGEVDQTISGLERSG